MPLGLPIKGSPKPRRSQNQKRRNLQTSIYYLVWSSLLSPLLQPLLIWNADRRPRGRFPDIRPPQELLTEYLPDNATIRLGVARVHMANRKPLYDSVVNREVNILLSTPVRKVPYLPSPLHLQNVTFMIGAVYGWPTEGLRTKHQRIGTARLAEIRFDWTCQSYPTTPATTNNFQSTKWRTTKSPINMCIYCMILSPSFFGASGCLLGGERLPFWERRLLLNLSFTFFRGTSTTTQGWLQCVSQVLYNYTYTKVALHLHTISYHTDLESLWRVCRVSSFSWWCWAVYMNAVGFLLPRTWGILYTNPPDIIYMIDHVKIIFRPELKAHEA